MSNLHDIKLSDISESPFNPRRHFDQSAIEELSKSIKENGVIQPIVVRPLGKKFELVCGARRYRASQLAKEKTIPALVRELTNEQALELQITENLQREGVHPLDEAYALQSMLKTGKTQHEVAARLGVSQPFVANRIKLLDLAEDLQTAYFENKITNEHAKSLSRVGSRDQMEIWKSIAPKAEMPGYNPKKIDVHWMIEQAQHLMQNATFDTTDPELYAKAGACSTCAKNTACSTVLFPEFADKPRCMDSECWDTKTDIAIGKLMEDPMMVVLKRSYSNDEKILARAKKMGKLIIETDYWRELTAPKEPVKPEWVEPDPEDFDKDGMVHETFEDWKSALMSDYESQWDGYREEMEEWRGQIEDFEKSKNNPKRGINAQTGKVIYYVPTVPYQGNSIPKVEITPDSPPEDIKQEITRLKEKEKRSLELDYDKEQAALISALKEVPEIKSFESFAVVSGDNVYQAVRPSHAETVALVYGFYMECSYGVQDEVKKYINLKAENYHGTKLIEALAEQNVATLGLLGLYLMRHMILHKYSSPSLSGESNQTRAVRIIAKCWVPDEKQMQIEQELQAKIKKRQENLENKIAALERQLKAKKQEPEQKDPVPAKAKKKAGTVTVKPVKKKGLFSSLYTEQK